jgi:hypothetical protein
MKIELVRDTKENWDMELNGTFWAKNVPELGGSQDIYICIHLFGSDTYALYNLMSKLCWTRPLTEEKMLDELIKYNFTRIANPLIKVIENGGDEK